VIGLFGGTSAGNVTGVSLDILANNVDTFKNIGNGAAAVSYFTDHAIDLGPLSGTAYASGALNLDITLKVTSDGAGAGFLRWRPCDRVKIG